MGSQFTVKNYFDFITRSCKTITQETLAEEAPLKVYCFLLCCSTGKMERVHSWATLEGWLYNGLYLDGAQVRLGKRFGHIWAHPSCFHWELGWEGIMA